MNGATETSGASWGVTARLDAGLYAVSAVVLTLEIGRAHV